MPKSPFESSVHRYRCQNITLRGCSSEVWDSIDNTRFWIISPLHSSQADFFWKELSFQKNRLSYGKRRFPHLLSDNFWIKQRHMFESGQTFSVMKTCVNQWWHKHVYLISYCNRKEAALCIWWKSRFQLLIGRTPDLDQSRYPCSSKILAIFSHCTVRRSQCALADARTWIRGIQNWQQWTCLDCCANMNISSSK